MSRYNDYIEIKTEKKTCFKIPICKKFKLCDCMLTSKCSNVAKLRSDLILSRNFIAGKMLESIFIAFLFPAFLFPSFDFSTLTQTVMHSDTR